MSKNNDFRKAKACIFDLDGTLMDSMGVWYQVDKQFFLSKGMKIPEDYQKAIAHMAFRNIARYTIDRFGFSETPDELIAIWMGIAQSEYAFNIQPKKNAKKLLSTLKEHGFSIALATSNQEKLYLPCLKNNALLGYFDILENVDNLQTSKSEPKIYLSLAERMHALPEETIVFEDILTAIKTAKKASFLTISMRDESSRKDWPEIDRIADAVIADFQEAIDLLFGE